MVSVIAAKPQNCHKYALVRAIHENVRFFTIFRHIKIEISILTGRKCMVKIQQIQALLNNQRMDC
jgi:hypothetical protein